MPESANDRLRTPPMPVLFVFAEVMLIAAIPLLGLVGLASLLGSTAGRFVAQPGPDEAGWEAFVDPSPVTLIIEQSGEAVTGAALIVQPGSDAAGGVVVLVPGDLQVDGQSVRAIKPENVPDVVARLFRLSIGEVHVLDQVGWEQAMGEGVLEVDNPDPIPVGPGESLIPIGRAELDPAAMPIFVGRPSPDAPLGALEVRRERAWVALLDTPTTGQGPVAELLGNVANGDHEVLALPWSVGADGLDPDIDEIETLVNRWVAFPVGAVPDDRARLRILSGDPSVDLDAVARGVGFMGFEIVVIGNTDTYGLLEQPDQNRLIVPSGVSADPYRALVDRFGADSVTLDEAVATDLVTLVVNADNGEPLQVLLADDEHGQP